jgi:hypothetical protein
MCWILGFGGAGNDWIRVPLATGTTVFGGSGDDNIDQARAGTIYGGAGNDGSKASSAATGSTLGLAATRCRREAATTP